MLDYHLNQLIKKYSKELTKIGYKLDSNENYDRFSEAFIRIANSIIPKTGVKYPQKDFSKALFESLFTKCFIPDNSNNSPLGDEVLKHDLAMEFDINPSLNENIVEKITTELQETIYQEHDMQILKQLDKSLLTSISKSKLREQIKNDKNIKILYDKGELTEEQEDIYTQLIHNYSTQKHD